MEFDKAKLAIKEMAQQIENGSFTQKELTEFILAFRFDLFQVPDEKDSSRTLLLPRAGITCSCGPIEESCKECGSGYTTGFAEDDFGNIVKFKIKK